MTKKLGVQTKRLEALICYDFYSRISNEEENVMFAIEFNMFSIRTIEVSTHIELVFKPIHKTYFSIVKSVPKQHVEPICVLVINLATPPNTIKQHLTKTFFHLKVEEMIIDETPIQE